MTTSGEILSNSDDPSESPLHDSYMELYLNKPNGLMKKLKTPFNIGICIIQKKIG